ncbi:50S ribosomal protein L11 methyltransferase [Escherichia coli]|nr:50S ribosomal protein L11 methyltransferase [Escherichia coli]
MLGLSGILASQAESVCEAYADSFALDPVVEKKSGAALPVVRINLRIAVG